MSALPNPQPVAPTAQDLLTAAERACTHWGDGPEARRAMRSDCLSTPPHLRAELIQHFEETYP